MNKDWMPVAAGITQLISGVFAFVGAGALAFSAAVLDHIPEIRDEGVPVDLLTATLGGLGVLTGVLAIVAVVGGIFAVRRRGMGWALAGSIAALFILMPLGIAALVLVLVGESAFYGRSPAPASGP